MPSAKGAAGRSRAVRPAPVLLVCLALAGCRAAGGRAGARDGDEPAPSNLAPLAPGETGLALVVGKLLTLDGSDRVFDPGLVLVRGDKLAYAGALVEVPAGYARLDAPELWAHPGFVDLHTHIHCTGWDDLNDMVKPLNPELRARPAIDPTEPQLARARAAGVTTLFGIPGSGSSASGFGTLYKPERDATYEEIVLRDPGGLKIAQNFNPQRGAGDVGSTWCGLAFNLEYLNDRAAQLARDGREDWELANLLRVHRGELPVLIHCASAEGVADAIRMWKLRYGADAVVSHGCWDGWHAARFAAETGTPVNVGPRTENLLAMRREDRFVGIAAEYVAAGTPLVSLNTDSPVVPEEELFLQGTMSARLGAAPYTMLRALTANPALSFQIGARVGSLEAGKDADLVLTSGDPLDPRSRIELVLIDGRVQYSRATDGPVL
jgi:imidazolonepropionase-like amidohydrolase